MCLLGPLHFERKIISSYPRQLMVKDLSSKLMPMPKIIITVYQICVNKLCLLLLLVDVC